MAKDDKGRTKQGLGPNAGMGETDARAASPGPGEISSLAVSVTGKKIRAETAMGDLQQPSRGRETTISANDTPTGAPGIKKKMKPLAHLPSWKARLACLLYEALTILAVTIIGLVIPHTLAASFFGGVSGGRLLLTHLFLMLLAYFAWQWLHGGQTLAMKTWKIRLRSADGTPLRFAQTLLRYAVAWPGVLLFGLGFIWALADAEGRYLHDRVAGTRLEVA
jgi:uncharacterized RDD family membrane protein YckC